MWQVTKYFFKQNLNWFIGASLSRWPEESQSISEIDALFYVNLDKNGNFLIMML